MLKFLLILFLFIYLVYRIGGFIVKILLGNSGSQGNQTFTSKPKDGNVTINYDPKDKKNKKGYQGGEYVDYEEVD